MIKIKKITFLLPFVFSAFLASSCAKIENDPKQDLPDLEISKPTMGPSEEFILQCSGQGVSSSDLDRTILALKVPALEIANHGRKEAGEPLLNDLSCKQILDVLRAQEVLNLNSTGVRDLRPLASFKQIKEIRLNRNEIEDLSPIQGYSDLRILEVSGNRVSSLVAISELSQLRTLQGAQNRLVSLVGLEGAFRLTFLDLSGNQIVDLKPISQLRGLRELNLRSNLISNVEALFAQKDNPGFKKLDLRGNPISKKDLIALRKALPKVAITAD